MKRVCVVITARPSYSRVKTALQALVAGGADLQVVAAASALTWRHGRIVDRIREDGFHVAAEVPSVVDGGGTRESVVSTGLLAAQLGPVLAALAPECVVTIADRHETLATAIAASYQNIPLCHVQGGEVTGSIDDKVRNAVTQLADLHFVATEQAGWTVKTMVNGARVCLTGCPSIDLAAEAKRLGPIHRADVVVLQHPVTSEIASAAEQIRATVEGVGARNALWFWPGEDAGADDISKQLRLFGIHPVRNLESVEFQRVLLGARVLVGNSSTGIREGSFLGTPVVNVGTRQQGRERATNVIDCAHDASQIAAAIKAQVEHGPYESSKLYGDGHAGERVAKALLEWQA